MEYKKHYTVSATVNAPKKLYYSKCFFFSKSEKTCFSVTGIGYVGRKMMMA